jgi:hypothetical protein
MLFTELAEAREIAQEQRAARAEATSGNANPEGAVPAAATMDPREPAATMDPMDPREPAVATTAAPAASAAPSGGTGNARSANPRPTRTSFNSQSIISLGTLIMSFVAKPLANLRNESETAPKFEEVQVFFYNFNDKAGMMSHCNISMFPIFTDFFAREYARTRLENASRAMRLTVSDFISFVANKMVDDPMNPAYNIQDLYKRASQTSNNSTTLEYANGRNGRSMTADEYNRKLEEKMRDPELGNVSGSPNFVMPQISFEMEAVPSARDPSGTKTILKIHVFDRACTPNSALRDLLSMSNSDLMSTLHALPGDRLNAEQIQQENRNPTINLRRNWEGIFEEIIRYAEGQGIIQHVEGSNPLQYQYTGGPARLKRLVSKYMPHIIYGAMGSNVKSATVNSKQDALLATINMQRSLNGDPVLPNGQQPGGVPLSIYPIDLSVTTLGCPLLRFSQEVFIDFNTNTTADNIYYIMGLTHKFEAGTYESTIKFTANDAFGQYRNFASQINNAKNIINSIRNQPETTSTTPTTTRR